ncbi:MAG TPA: glycosyltransferase [Tepidisphaeraceae bacterium]|jgi:glycosyltransferase involved in cell wall biosynthesis|nr:glycosyltransferase [Tepidisphaeraceae bacterium]
MPDPVVSILMPVGPDRVFLREAVQSVLRQTLAEVELIVIDDAGRPEELAELSGAASDARVRVMSNPGKGICDALNSGIAAARGPYIARCDADDRYPPDRLARHVAFLEVHGEFGAVCGGVHALSHHGQFVTDLHAGQPAQEITAELRQGKTRCGLWAFTIRREIAAAVGGFRRYFVTAEDIDFSLRLAERTRVWFDGELAYLYRLNSDSITHRQPTAARVFYEQTARRFAEQRRDHGADDLDLGHPPGPPGQTGAATTAAEVTAAMLIGAAWRTHRAGDRRQAVALALRACRSRPTSVAAWLTLAKLSVRNHSKTEQPHAETRSRGEKN